MYGRKRLMKDLEVVGELYKSNAELGNRHMFDSIERCAMTNYLAGGAFTIGGLIVYHLVTDCKDKIKKQKKNKELKDTDK